jgi:hypothetical protein
VQDGNDFLPGEDQHRAALVGRFEPILRRVFSGVTIAELKEHMADFKDYLKVEVEPGARIGIASGSPESARSRLGPYPSLCNLLPPFTRQARWRWPQSGARRSNRHRWE